MGPALSRDSDVDKSKKRKGGKKNKIAKRRPSILEGPDGIEILPDLLKEIYVYPGWNELFDPNDVVSENTRKNTWN